jgi:hypothetical protein
MYSAVTSWWQTRTEEKKQFLRRVLAKEGVHANQNNPVVSAAEFGNDVGSGWSFLEPLPTTKQRPPKSIESDTIKLIEQAGQLIKDTFNQIEQGKVKLSNTVGQGVDTAGHALDDFSNSVTNTAATVVGNALGQGGQQVVQQLSNLGDQATKEVNQFVNNPACYVNQGGQQVVQQASTVADQATNEVNQFVNNPTGYLDNAFRGLGGGRFGL